MLLLLYLLFFVNLPNKKIIKRTRIFFNLGNKIGSTSPQEQQVIVKAPTTINMENLTKLLSVGFKLSVLQGVDPNMNNVVAAGNFALPSLNTSFTS